MRVLSRSGTPLPAVPPACRNPRTAARSDCLFPVPQSTAPMSRHVLSSSLGPPVSTAGLRAQHESAVVMEHSSVTAHHDQLIAVGLAITARATRLDDGLR